MATNRSRRAKDVAATRVAQQLEALYAQLPKLACQGKCADVCTRILMSPGERRRIHREGGIEIPPPDRMEREGCNTCPALQGRRCTVYELRPTVCRLWGIDETMRCPFGCKPEGGWLSRAESVRFTLRTYMIAGWPREVPRLNPREVAELVRRGELDGLSLTRVDLRSPPTPAPPVRRSRNPLRRLRRQP